MLEEARESEKVISVNDAWKPERRSPEGVVAVATEGLNLNA